MIFGIKLIMTITVLSFGDLIFAQSQISRENLVEEFHILKSTLEELHPDLFRYTEKKAFHAKADSILQSLNSSLDPIHFYLRLSPLVTQIKNGHTSIRPPGKLIDSLSVLPFRLIAFEGKVYINKYLGASDTSLVGYEIKTINDIAVGEIVNSAIPYVSVDGFNESARFKAVVEDDLSLYYGLLYGEPEKYRLHLIDRNGLSEKKEFLGITYRQFLERYDHEDKFPWTIKRLDSGTAILTIRNFNNTAFAEGKKLSFAKTIEGIFKEIQKWQIERLILDIRFNGGGELKNSILLYRYLANEPFQFCKHLEMASILPPKYVHLTNYEKALKYAPINRKTVSKKSENVFDVHDHFSQDKQELMGYRFKGKLIVLINGNTASAAGALASVVKNDKRALIVGEENRDNYTGFSAGVPVILTLPYSGITVFIPIRKFTYAVGQDNGRGIMPDYFYASTHKSFFRPQDEQLDFLHELFRLK